MADSKNEEERGRSAEQVPVAYAEKAMSSLLRLHDDLVEEKEKRIDLYRRLMDREQQMAELRAYVQLLEAELSRQPGHGGLLSAATLPRDGEVAGLSPAQARLHAAPASGWQQADPVKDDAPIEAQAQAEAPEASQSRSAPEDSEPAGPAPIVAWIPANTKQRGRSG